MKFTDKAKPLTGKVGGFVFRKYKGQIIVSGYVAPRTPPTAGQRERRSLFKDATAYAKSVVGTAVWKEVYAPYALRTRRSVFSAAVADYMNPPVIDLINLHHYHGSPGDSIVIVCHDEFGVVAVRVAIYAKDQMLAEEGAATLEGGVWVYRATTDQAPGQTLTILATALDRPRRAGTKMNTLELIRRTDANGSSAGTMQLRVER